MSKPRLRFESDGSISYRNFKGAVVAKYDPATRTLSKTVSGSSSFRRFPPAITFDDFIVDNAVSRGADTIEVLDRDDGTNYRIEAAAFVRERFKVDSDYRLDFPQSQVIMSQWQRLDATGARLVR